MRRGLTQVYWGDGKGKTTAALGVALRALGSERKVHLVQFMKKGVVSGEIKALKKFKNFSYEQFGTREWAKKETSAEDKKEAGKAFIHLKESLKNYDLVVADEILYALQMNLIEKNKIIKLIESKPEKVELVLTGSHKAFPKIFEVSDLVTEIKKIKHPFDSGIQAREGIEY